MDPIIIIGAGLLAFFLWSQSQGASGGLPADAVYQGTVPVGTAIAVPQSVAVNPTGGAATTLVTGPATTAIAYVYYGPAENMEYFSYTAPTVAQTAAAQPEQPDTAPVAAPAPAVWPPAQSPTPASGAPATTPAPFIAGNSQSACPPGYVFAQAGFLPPTASAPLTTAGCVYMPSNPLATPLSGFRGMGAIRSPYWT